MPSTIRYCDHPKCRREATRQYRIEVPSAGYPIVNGSVCIALFLATAVCDEHQNALTVAEAIQRTPEARQIYATTYGQRGLAPDWRRASLKAQPMTEPDYLEWSAFADAEAAKRRRAVGAY